ncbi:MAG: LruC domain-containing protein [Prevotella sp.]
MNIKGCIAILLGTLALAGCSDDKELSAVERTRSSFEELLGGEYSTMQWWQTAIKLKVNVKTQSPTGIYAYFVGEESGILFDYKYVTKDSTFYMTVPQTHEMKVVLMAKEEKNMVTKEVILTGKPEQTVDMDIPKLEATRAAERAAYPITRAGQSLYGTDIMKNCGYTEIEPKGIEIVTQYTEEGMDIEKRGLNGNYELISQGPFCITMYYGYSGTYTPRILGYYRHSPGTYQDFEMVDLVDSHSYDYINGKAKLQYQLDGKDIWYDSNFDYRDGYTAPFTTNTDRLDDDVYNIQHVMDKYGTRMTKARGLTWEINVKPGDRIGFYLKLEGRQNSAQREHIVKKGLPSGRVPSTMYETNWSARVLNTDEKVRSVLIKDHGYTIMGMEDATSTGDFDCNDVLFGVHAELESEMPLITIPDIDIIVPSSNKQAWTIAYEDVWRDSDFDFNDAVIRIVPDYENETCGVELMAAGSTAKMYLHYDGSDGDQNLGEIHELLGQKGLSKVNTLTTFATIPFVSLGNVRWPKNYTIANDAKRFYIEVRRGTCMDCSDLLTLPREPGVMPQAILVAGSWHWPKEGIGISTAYSMFSPWAMDMTNLNYWHWHTSPNADTTVSYE